MNHFRESDADAFMRRLWLIIGAFVVLLGLPLMIAAYFLDKRLDAFEDALRYRPPQETAVEVADNDVHHLASNPVAGQVVYVPAYSHIYHGDGDPILLTITLSVRNTSVDSEIVVKSVRYFDTKGNEVKSYLKTPVRLSALGTTEVLIERDDTSGGSGANFLVEWVADRPVTEPIIEAVMIDANSQQGVSFARRGSVITEVVPDTPTPNAPEPDTR